MTVKMIISQFQLESGRILIMTFLLLLTIFVALAVAAAGITVTVSGGHSLSTKVDEEDVHYECVDDYDDFNCLNWDSSSAFRYAQSGKDLPPILRKHGVTLEGRGIFYFDGRQEVLSHQALIQWAMEFGEAGNNNEAFLYIKYYGHLPHHDGKWSSNQGMYVIPAGDDTEGGHYLKILRTTHDQQWQEELVLLSVEELRMSGLEVGAFNLGLGDYFLVEKLIFVQGVNITGIDHIKSFCSNSIMTASSRLKK